MLVFFLQRALVLASATFRQSIGVFMYRIYTGQFHWLTEHSGSPSAHQAASLGLGSVEASLCNTLAGDPEPVIYLGQEEPSGKIVLEPISLQELRRLAEGK